MSEEKFSFKKILGFEEYQSADKIIDFLKKDDLSQEFSVSDAIKIASNKEFKLWVVSSKTDIFIVRDNGFELKTLLKRKKEDFKFSIVTENKEPRLAIEDTITTLPLSTSLTGSTASFMEKLQKLKI